MNKKLLIIPLLSITFIAGCGKKVDYNEVVNSSVERFISTLRADENKEIVTNYLKESYQVASEMNKVLANHSSMEIENALNGHNGKLNNELSLMKENNILIKLNEALERYEASIDYEYLYNKVKDINIKVDDFFDYLINKANEINFSKIVFPNRDFVEDDNYEVIKPIYNN